MAKHFLLSLALCSLVLLHCCVARQQGQQQQQGECQIQRLNAREPQHRMKAEAGFSEFWDWTDDQFRCAGVGAKRDVIQPRGLILPSYTNAPSLIYITQGRGLQGIVMPGCPETYQSSQQQSQEQQHGERSQRFQDQHQKIREIKQGDIIALPAGVVHWAYNDGDTDLIGVVLEDITNSQNQLDVNPRRFFLAGNPQQSQPQHQGQHGQQKQEDNYGNVFQGFTARILAETFGVDEETARSLQSPNDQRGHIIRVERGLQVIRPPRAREESEQQERGQGQEQEKGQRGCGNGLEETICSAKLVQNIDNPAHADIFNPRAGRISTLNSFNLPILGFLQLSAEKGVLYRNAIMAPNWKVNAHSVLYATRGEARVQIVDHRGESVFNDRIQQGELVIVPQNFVVTKQAGNQGFEWVAFQTNDNAMFSTLAGRTSALRAIPVDVLSNAYQISREEANKLKRSREETVLFEGSSSGSERRAVA